MEKYDYESSGFGKFLRRTTVPPPDVTEDQAQITTPQIPAQTIKGDFSASTIEKAVNNLSKKTGTSSESYSGLSNGSTVTLSSTITDSTYPDKVMLAVCEITAYDGTLGAGASVIRTGSNFIVTQGFDYHNNATQASNGKSLTAYQSVYNQSGVSKNIYWYIRWRFLGTNTAAGS